MNINVLIGVFRRNIVSIVFECDIRKAYRVFKGMVEDALKSYIYVKPGRHFERIKRRVRHKNVTNLRRNS